MKGLEGHHKRRVFRLRNVRASGHDHNGAVRGLEANLLDVVAKLLHLHHATVNWQGLANLFKGLLEVRVGHVRGGKVESGFRHDESRLLLLCTNCQ